MKTALVLMCLSLCGCYQIASISDLKKAEFFCEKHLGIMDIRIDFLGAEYATCIDGEGANLDKVLLTPTTLE
jgi:hypothetical protein